MRSEGGVFGRRGERQQEEGEGRKEGATRGENFARLAREKRGGRKGENRERRATEISRRGGKTCEHYVHALTLSLSLSPSRDPRFRASRRLGEGENSVFSFPRVFHLPKLPCACRIRRNSRRACTPREQWRAALFTMNRGTFRGELKERGGVVGINRGCLR